MIISFGIYTQPSDATILKYRLDALEVAPHFFGDPGLSGLLVLKITLHETCEIIVSYFYLSHHRFYFDYSNSRVADGTTGSSSSSRLLKTMGTTWLIPRPCRRSAAVLARITISRLPDSRLRPPRTRRVFSDRTRRERRTKRGT